MRTAPSPLLPAPQSLKSPLLTAAGFRHGFYTRNGGQSGGVFASLNTSDQVGDNPIDVRENLKRIARSLAVEPYEICIPVQVHGCEIVSLTNTQRACDVAGTQADALTSSASGPCCAVRTADCVPLLFADPQTGTVAAVHAGWRGVEQNIVGATVESMRAQGSEPPQLLIAIGPHISVTAFEVNNEIAERLNKVSSAQDAVQQPKGSEKPHISLLAILRAQLAFCGLKSKQIDSVHGCTFGEPERFYSYRRDGAKSGRMLSVIAPRIA